MNGQRFVISIFNLRHDGNGAPKRLYGGILGALNIDAPETSLKHPGEYFADSRV